MGRLENSVRRHSPSYQSSKRSCGTHNVSLPTVDGLLCLSEDLELDDLGAGLQVVRESLLLGGAVLGRNLALRLRVRGAGLLEAHLLNRGCLLLGVRGL